MTSEQFAFDQVLRGQFSRYPKLEVQDLYKLVFQAAFGSEHAISGAAAARAWLRSEIQGLTEGPGEPEPAEDPISPNGRIARINLRPYLAAGGDSEKLLNVFVHTASEYRGTVEQLQRYWAYAVELVTVGQFSLSANQLADFFELMAARQYPAVHHSASYRRAYRPAYRVVLMELYVPRLTQLGVQLGNRVV